MSELSCRLLYRSVSPHLQQLYTGFRLLQQSGYLRLSQEFRPQPTGYVDYAPHLKDASHAHLDATVNGSLVLHFDTHDALEIAQADLERCDLYFKRSYHQETVDQLPASQRSKLFPLGLNYRVLPDAVDPPALRRGLSIPGSARTVMAAFKQALDVRNWFGFEPRLSLMEAEPAPSAEARVLFLVGAYDPYDDPERTPDKINDRIQINETRAGCLRLLKEALGPRFTGGFIPSRFTLEQYPDLVVPAEWTTQERYLATLKSFPICVASTGLHGSIGWKLAEYVAFSKAILSERLVYRTPGDFASGCNYVEFTTAQGCLEGAMRLVEDAAFRQRIMRNNAAYYRRYLRPDSLVRNALEFALQRVFKREPLQVEG